MATTIHTRQPLRERQDHSAHREGSIHYLAREAQYGLRWAVGISAAATVLMMIVMFYWAILPAMALLFFYVLLLITNFIEYRTQRPGDPVNDIVVTERIIAERGDLIESPEEHRLSMQVRMRLARTIAGIVIGVALGAAIIAGILFGVHLLAIGGLIVFAYWLLIAAPLWLGWLNDEAEEESRRAEKLLERE